MLGKEHLLFGLATGATTALALAELGIIDNALSSVGAEFVAFTVIGAFAPDIDSNCSTIGKLLRPLSTIIEKVFGHRTYFHDIFFLSILAFLSYKYINCNVINLYGFWFGVLGHLFLDAFTIMGIPYLYLFNKKKYFHWTPYSLRFAANSDIAKGVTIVLSILYVAGGLYLLSRFTGLKL